MSNPTDVAAIPHASSFLYCLLGSAPSVAADILRANPERRADLHRAIYESRPQDEAYDAMMARLLPNGLPMASPLAEAGEREGRLGDALIRMIEHFERVDASEADRSVIQYASKAWAGVEEAPRDRTTAQDGAADAKAFKRAFWRLSFDAVPAHDNPGDCKWRLSSTAVRILAGAAVSALAPRHEAPEGAGEIAKVLEFYAAEWDYHPGDGEAPDATHPGSAPTFYEAEPTDALKDDGGMMARAALAALRAAPEACEVKPSAWRCFHCDEEFTDRRCAAAHFGADEDAAPACQIKQGGERTMLEALRRAEKAAGEATFAMLNESTEAAQAYYSQQGRHAEQLIAAEQIGYERGLADASANPETLGLAATDLRESAK